LREKLSAVVVSYNRALLIGTCVRALGFADEVIVVDKSSTDGTAEIAAKYADRVITVPWSPTVEETRLPSRNAPTTGSFVSMTTSVSVPKQFASFRVNSKHRVRTSMGCYNAIISSARTTKPHITGLNIRSACSAAGP